MEKNLIFLSNSIIESDNPKKLLANNEFFSNLLNYLTIKDDNPFYKISNVHDIVIDEFVENYFSEYEDINRLIPIHDRNLFADTEIDSEEFSIYDRLLKVYYSFSTNYGYSKYKKAEVYINRYINEVFNNLAIENYSTSLLISDANIGFVIKSQGYWDYSDLFDILFFIKLSMFRITKISKEIFTISKK